MPSCRHSSRAALTASNSSRVLGRSPQAAIQLADSFTRAIDSMAPPARLVSASPIAMREAAAASITATGVRSPIAIASPA